VVARTARALVFSTRDLVLGASFMTFNVVVGSGIALLQLVARTPYAVGMFFCGSSSYSAR
jgi:hypothetical protein